MFHSRKSSWAPNLKSWLVVKRPSPTQLLHAGDHQTGCPAPLDITASKWKLTSIRPILRQPSENTNGSQPEAESGQCPFPNARGSVPRKASVAQIPQPERVAPWSSDSLKQEIPTSPQDVGVARVMQFFRSAKLPNGPCAFSRKGN